MCLNSWILCRYDTQKKKNLKTFPNFYKKIDDVIEIKPRWMKCQIEDNTEEKKKLCDVDKYIFKRYSHSR